MSQVAPELIPRRYAHRLPIVPRLVPFAQGVDGDGPFEKYQVRTQAFNTRILGGGLLTPLLGYNGIAPGPTIELERGTRAEVTIRNHLPATHPTFGHTMELATHLHGSASLPQFDGYAADLTVPGFMKTYHYPNHQPARTIWYHDHTQHVTAENVYSGLAAHYHIHDEEERALLPQGEFDVALTVDDVQFAADGRLMFDHRENSGVWGDVIEVNGAPWPVMRVEPRIYRFRLLNICVSRSFRFRLSNGEPVTMVATDGGLMPRSRQVLSWRHGPAERYEFLVDFRQYAGRRIELLNSSNDNNRDFDFTDKVMAFDVHTRAADDDEARRLARPDLEHHPGRPRDRRRGDGARPGRRHQGAPVPGAAQQCDEHLDPRRAVVVRHRRQRLPEGHGRPRTRRHRDLGAHRR